VNLVIDEIPGGTDDKAELLGLVGELVPAGESVCVGSIDACMVDVGDGSMKEDSVDSLMLGN
jgi:hypothetical protein